MDHVPGERDRVVFRLVPQSRFSALDLLEYPAWSEFYDSAERDEIVSWGIDADWLGAQLAVQHTGDDHAVYPLLQTDPLPERMRIYFRARFETPHGSRLSGYVINEDAYCLCVYLSGEEFVLNRQIRGTSTGGRLDRLRQLLRAPDDPILPLRYQTDFYAGDGRRIEGVFEFAALR